jgi:hypothetical protein
MWRKSMELCHTYVDPTPSGVKVTSVKEARMLEDIAS